jgi:imidazolonepropionase-like amidohydrolase
VRMSATAGAHALIGRGELADGKSFTWTADRKEAFKPEPDTTKPKAIQMSSFPPMYPPGAFGRAHLPEQFAKLFVHGATVWTCGPQGTLENADLLVEKGKIVQVGKNLTAPADAVVVDGSGKHVTPGLIDCHSHTGVAGSVNETGQAITAMVRIGDVLDPDDIALYRELAGGLTAANVLHGSANPIGGQNQVIKLRWGSLPEDMKFEGAMQGIKFALGENPKQSNWGDKYTTRYPQTRGGVEEIIRDEFRAALDYEKSWKDFESGKRHIPPRRDLQSEAVLEVLRGKRLVHCHSYRQDEILMLMRVAEEFGFKIGTFQHVLEGYKVADQLARHGAGASTFSDWWAYKFEVYDAIPYNGAIMHDAGVVVSYNSDSDEQARRLNTEAAKAVKYGGVSQEEALKFVTINPAIQLHVDKRTGSLESGKDADFAVWNGNPLSTYSICEQTWIDGRKYFDRDEDRKMNDEVQKERAALVQKALGSKKGPGGESKPQPSMGEKEKYSCHEEYTGKEQR